MLTPNGSTEVPKKLDVSKLSDKELRDTMLKDTVW